MDKSVHGHDFVGFISCWGIGGVGRKQAHGYLIHVRSKVPGKGTRHNGDKRAGRGSGAILDATT